MADYPPSYQAAAYREVLWQLVAPFVESRDLCSACLVSQEWHATFSPHLWGNPAARFGLDSDEVYLSLTRFKRLLKRVRLDVRRLAHTLHLPPAQPELYDGPKADWLRDLLDRLPCLQALIVSNLSFFDHQSVQSIHQAAGTMHFNAAIYPLRLLIASDCENTTASSLATAISHFPALIYLDLSSTKGSRSPHVLRQISLLSELRVLKLQACGLRDDDISYLDFPKSLRSLDLSHNLLTERGVSKIVVLLRTSGLVLSGNAFHAERLITARRYSGVDLRTRVINTGLESFVMKRLTEKIDGYLELEEGIPTSFSYLYLSGNQLTVDGTYSFLDSPRLQHLDCGHLNCSSRPFSVSSPRSPGAEFRKFSYQPEPEILSPYLFVNAFRSIRSLRIHHSVITSYPFSGTEVPDEQQCFELHGEDLRYELAAAEIRQRESIFELADTSRNVQQDPDVFPSTLPDVHAVFESPEDVGASIPEILSVKPIDVSSIQKPGLHSAVNNHPRIPRKAVPPCISISSHEQTPACSPAGPEIYQYRYSARRDRCWGEEGHKITKPETIEEVLEEAKLRRQRTEARERHPGRFKPSMLPNLKILALTDVPSLTRQREMSEALITFVHECAEEEELARLEDLVRQQHSELGTRPTNSDTTSISKLQRLVLEISPTSPFTNHTNSPLRSLYQHSSSNPRLGTESFSKSSTADPDSETFMQASSTDFSFFREDDGGLLTSDGRIDAELKMDNGMLVNDKREVGRVVDVVSEVAAWRRERRAAWERMRRDRSNSVEMALLGHWRGELKVVRESAEG